MYHVYMYMYICMCIFIHTCIECSDKCLESGGVCKRVCSGCILTSLSHTYPAPESSLKWDFDPSARLLFGQH